MPAHQREQPAVAAGRRIDFPPAGQEVVVDDAADMEAIGHDAGMGEVPADQRAVDAGQIHTDHPRTIPAGQALQVVLQGGLAAAEHDVEDGVLLQPCRRLKKSSSMPSTCGQHAPLRSAALRRMKS
jgi:hypothetical protein